LVHEARKCPKIAVFCTINCNEYGVKFVDFRFTDTKGKEQHVSIPASQLEEETFTEGKMFDGSSVAGWKGINESDMILMPDPETATLDPFTDEPTINITCNVVEPATGEGYERDPRSIALRAEAYLKASGIADTAYFGPENEFFVFDDVKWSTEMGHCSYQIDSEEAAWSSIKIYEDGNIGHRPGVKGGYFPVPPVDSLHDIRSAMSARHSLGDVPGDGRNGPQGRSPSPRSGNRRSVRNRCRLQHPGAQG
jgi:glutamine synthetase